MKKSSGTKEMHRRSKQDCRKGRSRDSDQAERREKSPRRAERCDEIREETGKEMEHGKTVASKFPDEPKPLSTFVHDREALLEQVFAILRDFEVAEITPKSLKKYSIDQLKQICLKELKDMSESQVLRILKGGSVESGEKRSSEEKLSSDGSNVHLKRKLEELEASNKRAELYNTSIEKDSSMILTTIEAVPKSAVLQLHPKDSEKVAGKKETSPLESGEERDPELLELEMRARAIRSLLRSRGLPISDDDDGATSNM